jgi:hypothetical protein
MVKEKVTLTLDSEHLAELRSLVGARSVSATVDAAILAYLQRMRRLVAVDEWMAEREHGPRRGRPGASLRAPPRARRRGSGSPRPNSPKAD